MPCPLPPPSDPRLGHGRAAAPAGAGRPHRRHTLAARGGHPAHRCVPACHRRFLLAAPAWRAGAGRFACMQACLPVLPCLQGGRGGPRAGWMCAPKGASPSWASLTLSTVATRSSGKHGAHDVPVEPACKAAGPAPCRHRRPAARRCRGRVPTDQLLTACGCVRPAAHAGGTLACPPIRRPACRPTLRRECVRALRPRRLIPTVDAADAAASRAVVDRFADLMDLSADRSRLDCYLRRQPQQAPVGEEQAAAAEGGAEAGSGGGGGGRGSWWRPAGDGQQQRRQRRRRPQPGGRARRGQQQQQQRGGAERAGRGSPASGSTPARRSGGGGSGAAVAAALGTTPAARGAASPGAAAGGAAGEACAVEVDLAAVDVAEQQRILAAIQARNSGTNSGGSGGKRRAPGSGAGLRQGTLKRFFASRSQPSPT